MSSIFRSFLRGIVIDVDDDDDDVDIVCRLIVFVKVALIGCIYLFVCLVAVVGIFVFYFV